MATELIIESNARFRMFLLEEIYTGENGTGRYVPNVDDMVWDWGTGIRYRVTSVDYTTGLSDMEVYVPPTNNTTGVEQDSILASSPGATWESYRVYINTTTTPFRMAFDSRLHVYGSNSAFVKVFRGVDISSDGVVVSAMFDQNGNMTSENIPLETVAGLQDNTGVKTPVEGYSTEDLNDGEIVTIVAYNNDGVVITAEKLIVKNTEYVRTSNASKRYITSIALTSPYLSESDNELIQLPVNVPLQSGMLMGQVQYSDGTSSLYPIDGTKFSLHGLDRYISTVVGQRIDLVLKYRLSQGEYSTDIKEVGDTRFMTRQYELETMDADGSYTVKIFTVPVWVDSNTGYILEHYLYNLDRDEIFDVTAYVERGLNSPQFKPKDYGGTQEMVFALDLDDIDPIFNKFRHVQHTNITLLRSGVNNDSLWKVQYTTGGYEYGEELTDIDGNPVSGTFAAQATHLGSNNYDLDLTCQLTSLETWLHNVYYKAEPLHNPATEGRAPEPTKFAVVVDDVRIERDLYQWDTVISSAQIPGIRQGKPIYLEFMTESGTGDLQLGLGALPAQVTQA